MGFREYHKATRCERRGLLFGCRKSLEGQCQYCTRGFCGDHGERFGEGEEVCARKVCQAKRRDLEDHVRYRDDALERNQRGICGDADCSVEPLTDCQRCGAHFCTEHLRQQMTTADHRGERVAEMLRLCHHCRDRIALWESE